MVPEGHQHHRLRRCPQPVDECRQLPVRLHNGSHVGVHGVSALRGILLPGKVLLRPGVPGGVGAVALDVDGEGETGLPRLPALFQVGVDLRQQNGVLRIDRLGHPVIVPLQIPVLLKPQIPVDVLPVIEPLVIGMAPLDGVPLLPEIPGVGVGIPPKIPQLIISGQEAPLRINGASGKDIGHQIAGIALRLQGVIEIVPAGVQPRHAVTGEIHIGLPHEPHEADFPLLRNIRVRIFLQKLRRLCLVVPRRRHLHKIGNAVEEGIPEAMGDVILCGAPLVEVAEVPGVLIDLPVQDHRGQRGCPGHSGQRPCSPPPPGASHTGCQQPQQSPSQQQAEYGKNNLPINKQRVVVSGGHGLGLTKDEHVLKVEGVIPELELIEVPQAETEGDASAQEEGGAGPACEAIEEEDQQGHRDGIQQQSLPVAEVVHQGPPGVWPDGQHQEGQAHAQACAEQQGYPVDIVEFPLSPAPAGGRLLLEQKIFFPEFFQVSRPSFRGVVFSL